MTITDCFQAVDSSSFLCSDCCNQTIDHNILFLKAHLISSIQNCMYNAFFFITVLWKSLIRKRKQNEHRTIFSDQRKDLLHFYLFQRYRIHKCTSRIDTKCRFDNSRVTGIHMAGVNAQWTIHRGSHFINRADHHFFLINTIHADIDIKD